jgi:hypothetical protein
VGLAEPVQAVQEQIKLELELDQRAATGSFMITEPGQRISLTRFRDHGAPEG